MTLVEKYCGCMVGLAVGDALGAPFVGMTPAQADALGGCGEFLPSLSASSILLPISDQGMSERGVSLDAGQWTEDTQLTIALAASIVDERGYFIPESWSHALVQWLNGEPRSPGTSTIQAALQLRTGAVLWDESADPDGAGSGAAARVAPIALMWIQDAATRREGAVVQAMVSHGHPDAQAAAVAVSEAIALSAEGGSGEALISAVVQAIRQGPPEWSEFARCLAVAQMMLADRVEPESAIRVLGTSGWCREAVPCALYIAARSADTFEQAVCRAATCSGATDTIACITGAVAGARHGLSAIPIRWQYRVENAELLVGLARSLYRLSSHAGGDIG